MSGSAAVFAVGDGLVALSASCLVARLKLRRRLDRLVAFGVIAVTQIELSLLVAGAGFQSLRRPAVLLVNAAFTAVAVALGGRRLVTVMAAAWRSPRDLRRPAARLAAAAGGSPWATVLVLLAAGEFAWRLFVAVLLPPFAYDAINYHLTTTAEWVQHGRLVIDPLNPCCGHYPLNTELAFAWPALLTGSDRLVDSVQLGFALLGALGVAGIGRVVGLSRSRAAAAGAMFFLTPVVLAQSNTAYVDVAFAGMFLCGAFMVLRYALDSGRPAHLLLGGLATGFTLGAKGDGFVYAGVLLVVVAGLAWRGSRLGAPRPTPAPGVLGRFAAATLLTGGFWYARNLLTHGNPVYPFQVSVAGVSLFSGPLHVSGLVATPPAYSGEAAWLAVLHSWLHDASPARGGYATYGYQDVAGGFGIVWPWLMLPALAAFTVFAARRRRDILLTLLLPAAAIIALSPGQWWSRYTLFLPGLGAVALAHGVQRLGRRRRLALQLAAIALVGWGAAEATRRVDPAGYGRSLSAARVVRLASAPARERTLGRLFFPEYAWLDRVPAHATIAVEVGPEPRFVYPLFGSTFSRRVDPLASGAASARALERELARDHAGYVLVGAASRLGHLARFDRALHVLYAGRRVDAYRVIGIDG